MRLSQKSPTIVVYSNGSSIIAEDNSQHSRSIANADPSSAVSVQNLIASVFARLTTLGGGHAFFNAGTYLMNSVLAVPDNAVIGGTPGLTNFDIAGASSSQNHFTLGNNCQLRGLQLIGTGARTKPIGGIYASGKSNFLIEDLVIAGGKDGIRLDGCSDFQIRRYVAHDLHGTVGSEWAPGFNPCNCNRGVLEHFKIYDSDRAIEVEDGSNNITVRHGYIYNITNDEPTLNIPFALNIHWHGAGYYTAPTFIKFDDIVLLNCYSGLLVYNFGDGCCADRIYVSAQTSPVAGAASISPNVDTRAGFKLSNSYFASAQTAHHMVVCDESSGAGAGSVLDNVGAYCSGTGAHFGFDILGRLTVLRNCQAYGSIGFNVNSNANLIACKSIKSGDSYYFGSSSSRCLVSGCFATGNAILYGDYHRFENNDFASFVINGANLHTVFINNKLYVIQNNGSSTGTGSEQTIAHGLNAIRPGVSAWAKYLIGTRYITEIIPFDATNIYPTVETGVAYEWRIE